MMKRLMLTGALATCVMGCAPIYNISSIEDHPDRELTMIQVQATRTVVPLFYKTSNMEFWLCKDEGDTLSCQRTCTPSENFDMVSTVDTALCPEVGGFTVKRTTSPNIFTSGSTKAPPAPTPAPTPEPPTPEPADDAVAPDADQDATPEPAATEEEK